MDRRAFGQWVDLALVWLLAAVVSSASVSLAQDGPCEMEATPSSGPPGTRVGVAGACAGILHHRFVYIYFDIALVSSFDASGPIYSTGFTVPQRARPGMHEISLRAPFGETTTPFEVTGPPPACIGDCDLDERVAVDELVTGVRMALDDAGAPSCPQFDPDQSGQVSIDELTTAVNAALIGCARAERCRDARDCEEPLVCRSRDPRLDCEDCEPLSCVVAEDCDEEQECDASGLCIGVECQRAGDCPANHSCIRGSPKLPRISHCKRNTCVVEICDGYCVNGWRQDALGMCGDPLPAAR
jgi:hypothetical protein